MERPVLKTDWTVRMASQAAAATWHELAKRFTLQARAFWDLVTADPRAVSTPHKHHRLTGDLKTQAFKGQTLEHWQHEVSTTGARIWFVIDDVNHEVHVTETFLAHPNATK